MKNNVHNNVYQGIFFCYSQMDSKSQKNIIHYCCNLFEVESYVYCTIQTSYTFACQKWLPVVATGFMIEENNSLVMLSSAGWCRVVRCCEVLHRVV